MSRRASTASAGALAALLLCAASTCLEGQAPDTAAPSRWSASLDMRRPFEGAFWSGKGHLGADVFFEGWGVGVTTSWAHSGSASAESLKKLRETALLIRRRLRLGRRHAVTLGGGFASFSGSRVIPGSYRQICGAWCTGHWEEEALEGRDGAAFDASYRLRLKEGWGMLPNALVVAVRTSHDESMGGFSFGFGWGRAP